MSEKPSREKEARMFKEKGNTCFRYKKYQESIAFYTKAIELCPKANDRDLAIYYQNRAAANHMLKRWNQVIEDCSKSVKYDRFYAKAYFRRSQAYEAKHEMLNCLIDFTVGESLDSMFDHKINKDNNSENLERITKEAALVEMAKDLVARKPMLPSSYTILRYFQMFIKDPVNEKTPQVKNPKGYIRAKMAFDNENYDDIIPACSEEINYSKSKYKAEAFLLRGTFHILAGCFKEALTDLNEIIYNKVKCDVNLRANALIKRGFFTTQVQDKDLGIADFDEAEKLLPNNPDLHSIRGQYYLVSGPISMAVEEFNKTLKLAPSHIITYARKYAAEHSIAEESKDTEYLTRVTKDIEILFEKYPDCLEIYPLMAQTLLDKNLFEETDSLYEKAIQLSPKVAETFVSRARLMLRWKNDTAAAVQSLKNAIEIDDKCIMAFEELGKIELTEHSGRSIENLEKAISLSKLPSHISELYELRNFAIAEKTAKQIIFNI